MVAEWSFLMSILLVNPQAAGGWDITRSSHVFPDLAACETAKEQKYQHYRTHPVMGGAVVITGCEPGYKE